jgi:4-amino-4-deoxy-L-arabinose transferase-like glycosyltransferase
MKLTEPAFQSSSPNLAARSESACSNLFGERFRLLATMVLLLAAVMFFWRLGGRSLWASEGRWAEVSREMTVTGNYFWPTINGRVYYDKPLLSYWLVVGASKLMGGIDEAAVRIPSAVAGLIAVGLTLFIARRLYGGEIAISAAVVLLSSFSFVFFSRHASADMETVAGELAALALFLENRARPTLRWLVPFWLMMALTSLTKGLLGFALPLLIAASYACLADGWQDLISELTTAPLIKAPLVLIKRNRWLFNRKTLAALPIAAAFYLLPFIASYIHTGSNLGLYMVFRENILRFVRPFDHRGPLLLYIPVIFALLAPWSAFLPGALLSVHQLVKRPDPTAPRSSDRFTLTFFWVTFIFFTASGSRRSYYLLPILPAGALLVARALSAQSRALSSLARRMLDAGFYVVVGATILGAVALVPPSLLPGNLSRLPSLPHPYAFAAMWLIAAAGVIYALIKPGVRLRLAATFVSAYLSLFYLFIIAMPAVEPYRGERIFARAVVARLNGAHDALAMYKIWGPGLAFYLGSPRSIPDFEEPAALSSYLAHGGARWVITRAQDLDAIPQPFTIVEREPTFPWEPKKRTQSKYLLLRIGRD